MGLELYARIEPLLGFEEQKKRLYELFLHKLQELGVQRVLDVGCGSGAFMALAKERGFEIVGVDLSYEMVERATNLGLEAYAVDVCELDGKFDAVCAIFDVVNYMPLGELERFFGCIAKRLESGGYFLCDINTLYGFEEVAQGSLIVEQEERCVAIDASFEDGRLVTDLILFEKTDNCYEKRKDRIVQYYHEVTELKRMGLRLVGVDFVELYGDEPDKALLTFVKD